MSDRIFWAAPDGSWGGCERDDLLAISMSDIPVGVFDEITRLADEGDDDGIYEALANLLPLAAADGTPVYHADDPRSHG
jgi:hypothetical protein